MKKIFIKLFAIILCIATYLSTSLIVQAETIPTTMHVTNYVMSNTPMSFPTTYRIKKTTDGKYIYCTYYAKYTPAANVTYTKGNPVTDNGISYILSQALNVKNDTDYFIYQNALWIYMVDKGIMPQPYHDLTVFNSQVKNSNSTTANQIKNIVAKAKTASAVNNSAPTINLDTSTSSFTLSKDGKYYVSNQIKVNSSTGNYTTTLTSAPEGSSIEKNGNNFTIKVPADKVTSLKTTIKFKVSNSKKIYSAYYYNPNNSSYQIMSMAFESTKTAVAEGNLTINTGGVSISKQDITDKEELPGATLIVKDSNGNIIDEWISTNEPHIIEGLKPGTYTLTEKIAPDGYILSSETINFTIKNDGSIEKVVMYNEKQTGSVSISKQDITNKKELPGATLVVKDSNGNIIDEWVSTNEPHIIKGLKPGTYTLTEKIAPNGYTLSNETINFTVKNDGSITKVIMYNKPNTKEEISVENTSSFKTITSSLIGSIIIVIGSYIIIKRSKKEIKM